MRLILGLTDEQSKHGQPSSDVVAPEGYPALGEEHSQGEETFPSSLTGRGRDPRPADAGTHQPPDRT